MRLIKTFENWHIPSEDKFQEISDTLQEIFDEYNIPFMSNEEIERMEEEDDALIPFDEWGIKHWRWSYNREGIMSQINIGFVKRNELNGIINRIKEMMSVIKGRTGWRLTITEDTPEYGEHHIILTPTR